jgi:hypothetical protein
VSLLDAGDVSLDAALVGVATFAHPDSVDRFRRDLDPQWIEDALTATGTATLRRRRLPAEQVVWLVLGMALFRDRSILEVVSKLESRLAWPARAEPPAPSAVSQARTRLGPEPAGPGSSPAALRRGPLRRGGSPVARARALTVWTGRVCACPTRPPNRAHFGGHPAGNGRGRAPTRCCGWLALMALRSHLLVAAEFGPWATGEHTYARRAVAPRCLTTR